MLLQLVNQVVGMKLIHAVSCCRILIPVFRMALPSKLETCAGRETHLAKTGLAEARRAYKPTKYI